MPGTTRLSIDLNAQEIKIRRTVPTFDEDIVACRWQLQWLQHNAVGRSGARFLAVRDVLVPDYRQLDAQWMLGTFFSVAGELHKLIDRLAR